MIKCICGYECRLPGEAEMLEQYGCAKTILKRSGPFNSVTMVQCSHDEVAPHLDIEDDGEAFKEAFMQNYDKNKKK